MSSEASFYRGNPLTFSRVAAFVAALLVMKVTANVVLGYRDYFRRESMALWRAVAADAPAGR